MLFVLGVMLAMFSTSLTISMMLVMFLLLDVEDVVVEAGACSLKLNHSVIMCHQYFAVTQVY
jgi:hypothetical protein